jgi:hypothetical protein
MNPHLLVLASLGVAILLSPEIFILGLLCASERARPRMRAWVFALGTAVGLGIAWYACNVVFPPSDADPAPAAESGSWLRFGVHLAIAIALAVLGVLRVRKALRAAPVDGVPAKVGAAPRKPSLLQRLAGTDELSLPRKVARSFLLGFACTGPHPKVFPVVIAASRQLDQLSGTDQGLGVVIFAVIALLPGVAPAVIETIRPGSAAGLMEASERFMETKGRWLGAVILLAAAAFVGWNAFGVMPRG